MTLRSTADPDANDTGVLRPGCGAEWRARAQVNSVLMQLPWNDWEIGPNEIEVLQREDGTDWKLGEGASGSVRGPFAAATTVASTCTRGQGRQDGSSRDCHAGSV